MKQVTCRLSCTACTGFFSGSLRCPFTGTTVSLSDILHKVGNLGMSFVISLGIPIQLDSRDQQALLLLTRAEKTGFTVTRRQRRLIRLVAVGSSLPSFVHPNNNIKLVDKAMYLLLGRSRPFAHSFTTYLV